MAISGGPIVPEAEGFLADAVGLTSAFVAPGLRHLFILYFVLYVRARPVAHVQAAGPPPVAAA